MTLTYEQLVDLKPGRPMDALVAEHVLGWRWQDYVAGGEPARGLFPPPPGPFGDHDFYLNYSTDDDAALHVAERLRQLGWLVRIQLMPDGFPYLMGDDWVSDPKLHARYLCTLSWMGQGTGPHGALEDSRKRIRRVGWYRPWARGETIAEAVCRVGLMALIGDLVDPPEGWSVLDPEANRG